MVFHVYDDKVMLKLVVSVAEVLGKIQVLPLTYAMLMVESISIQSEFKFPFTIYYNLFSSHYF